MEKYGESVTSDASPMRLPAVRHLPSAAAEAPPPRPAGPRVEVGGMTCKEDIVDDVAVSLSVSCTSN